MPRQDDLQKQIAQHNRRLQLLKEREARQGINTPPEVITEVEDIEDRIEELKAQLAEVNRRGESPNSIFATNRDLHIYQQPAVSVAVDPKLMVLRAQPRIFLCHAKEDKPQVQELYNKLKDAGYHPWLDKFDLLPGQQWRTAIKRIITNLDNLVLVCLSQHSITKRGVVQQEIKWALDILEQMPEEAIYLIPVRLEECQVPEQLSPLHWVNLFEPDGFEYLTRALDFEIGKRRAVPTPEPKPPKSPHSQNLDPKQANPLPKVITPQHAFEPKLILIPAGEFLMGSDPDIDKDAQKEEQPQYTLHLPAYYIAETPVTNVQYAAFVRATHYQTKAEEIGWSFVGTRIDVKKIIGANWQHPTGPGSDISQKRDHPVVQISWHDAVTYCEWLSEATGRDYRLPTEAEWEKAARGRYGRIYPWGNEWNPKRCNNGISDLIGTTPVGAYPDGASPYGVLDMVGNVIEQTLSLWGADALKPDFKYPYDATDGRENIKATEKFLRVARGGSWSNDSEFYFRCANRSRDIPSGRHTTIGFRVVSPI
jgi:formylglycine-generating enzyme required for sulfatase activity